MINRLESYGFALDAARAIARKKTTRWNRAHNIVYSYNHAHIENLPKDETLERIFTVLSNENIKHHGVLAEKTNWLKFPWNERELTIIDYAGIAINFTDFLKHKIKIPGYLYPPSHLCQILIHKINSSEYPLRLDDQLREAIKIVGPYPMAACYLLMVTTRMLARNSDRIILNKLKVPKKDLQSFTYHIASFDRNWTEKEPPDPSGNTYYFWTNMVMGMILNAKRMPLDIEKKFVSFAFDHGPEIMWHARKRTAGEANIVHHTIPARNGLEIGKELARRFIK